MLFRISLFRISHHFHITIYVSSSEGKTRCYNIKTFLLLKQKKSDNFLKKCIYLNISQSPNRYVYISSQFILKWKIIFIFQVIFLKDVFIEYFDYFQLSRYIHKSVRPKISNCNQSKKNFCFLFTFSQTFLSRQVNRK